jgi:inward rectifier potassium channel
MDFSPSLTLNLDSSNFSGVKGNVDVNGRFGKLVATDSSSEPTASRPTTSPSQHLGRKMSANMLRKMSMNGATAPLLGDQALIKYSFRQAQQTANDKMFGPHTTLQSRQGKRLCSGMFSVMLRMRWGTFLGATLAIYFLIVLCFAALACAGNMNDSMPLATAKYAKILDAFFWATETFSTIGYGQYRPSADALWTNAITDMLAITTLLFVSTVSGVFTSKLVCSLASSNKIVFSRHAVFTPPALDSKYRSLKLRICALRPEQLVMHAKTQVLLNLRATAPDGSTIRTSHSLSLLDHGYCLLPSLAGEVTHIIDETSPLFSLSNSQIAKQVLADSDMRLVVAVEALDSVFKRPIHASHFYHIRFVQCVGFMYTYKNMCTYMFVWAHILPSLILTSY